MKLYRWHLHSNKYISAISLISAIIMLSFCGFLPDATGYALFIRLLCGIIGIVGVIIVSWVKTEDRLERIEEMLEKYGEVTK